MLKIAVQMDPLEGLNLAGDSTYAMMLEAQLRGHRLWHYEVRHLSLREGRRQLVGKVADRVFATARRVTLRGDGSGTRDATPLEVGAAFEVGAPEMLALAEMDVVLMRQDPPFDMAYISATHILEHLQPGTLVVNDPAAVRNAPEKLLVTHYPDLMPPTLVTWDPAAVRAFRDEFEDIIVKPLFGNGGAGVFRIKPGDENLASLLEMHAMRTREPLMVQRYEKAVRQGDKRIILIDGEAAGAINRVPAEGEARSNMHVGGRAERVALTARDQEICARIGPFLRDNGLIFVGIDVIGDYLTEINVTSPTGLREIARFDGVNLAGLIWDRIEAKVQALAR
jgi:glutathione synthase